MTTRFEFSFQAIFRQAETCSCHLLNIIYIHTLYNKRLC